MAPCLVGPPRRPGQPPSAHAEGTRLEIVCRRLLMASHFAMYIPRIGEGTLLLRFLLVGAALAAIIVYARQRWGMVASVVAVAGGLTIALMPQLIAALFVDLGGYGDLCRQANHVPLPDWLFVIIAYFDVGWGMLVLLAGALAGCLMLECLGRFLRRRSHGIADIKPLGDV